MRALEVKQRLVEMVSSLAERRLKSIINFTSYQKNRKETEVLWKMQMNSQGYLDWLSSENDIYDEVFKLDQG